MLTIGRLIRCAARRPDRIAIAHGDRVLSYGDLVGRMNRVAHLARDHYRLVAGDRVVLIAANCLPYMEIVAGFSDAGAIVATLNPALSAAEIATVLTDCEPRLIIADPNVEVPDTGVERLALGNEYEALLAQADDRPFHGSVEEHAAFALAYTSGTTGAPKGALLSHRSRALTFLAMAGEYGCFGPDDHFLAIAPMCHGAGFAFAAAPLAFGGTVTLFDGGDPRQLLERLWVGDVSGVFMVPTHIARLAASPSEVLAQARARGHGLKTIICNAAALPQAGKEFVIDLFGDGLLHETYGSTEAGIVTNIRPADLLSKPGTVGLPFVNMEVEVRRDDGDVAAPDEIGELFSRGPTSFSGYWRRPDDTAATMRDGWISVGDLARRDSDGFITIVDRKKDMIISGGLNVYPREVELIIAAVAGVRDVAVVGLPDAEWGERVHAFVVGDADSEAAILACCRERLAGYKRPRTLSFLNTLPRNASGKVLKRELRDGSFSLARGAD